MIESLEPRRLMAASLRAEDDMLEGLADGGVALRRGTLFVRGAGNGNVINVHLSKDRRNVNVAARFGAAAAGAGTKPTEEQFAAALVRRVVVRGGDGADRIAVGSLPEVVDAEGKRLTYALTNPAPGDEQIADVDAATLTEGTLFDAAAVAFSDVRQLQPRRGVRILGGAGNDVLIGSGARDHIAGGEGVDTLVGLGDRDRVDGGTENDTIEGGPGGDHLIGGEGHDQINLARGSQRQDRIFGGPGNDIIDFAAGVKLRDREGDDVIQDRIR